ncbi:iron-sulfur cluster biosynthesis protein [Kibdelosporangium aridum]|uniref:Iron-sulfur cluster biosynthesis protein n=1 Tax=Kibdelosporangium aridum TaxID=2030 RepID=A0A428ZB10_KIBAR|nr:hypothetical protein [Kibdelosporangium aridum]RSM85249.1 iron-sulfur cluster biosynthesis protein [Kibdelosporangium aridum]
MLTVTEAAAEAIKNMSERGGVQDVGGLRVDVAPQDTDGRTFALSMAPEPSSGDQIVVVRPGAHVFIHPDAAAHISDTILDVGVADGRVRFRLLRRRERQDPQAGQ